MNIGQASASAGLTMKMVRRYEQLGLLGDIDRGPNKYRKYTESDVLRLKFIKRARSLDFSIKQIRELLDLWVASDRRCSDVLAITVRHAQDLEMKAEFLRKTVARLQVLAASCDASDRSDCAIIHSLESGLGFEGQADEAVTAPAPCTWAEGPRPPVAPSPRLRAAPAVPRPARLRPIRRR